MNGQVEVIIMLSQLFDVTVFEEGAELGNAELAPLIPNSPTNLTPFPTFIGRMK